MQLTNSLSIPELYLLYCFSGGWCILFRGGGAFFSGEMVHSFQESLTMPFRFLTDHYFKSKRKELKNYIEPVT